jgi:hypothetical protein
MAYATVQDVEVRLGRELSPEEEQLVQVRLEDVENMIRARIPNLDQLIADGDLDEDLVVMIEAEAVLRVIRNPEGYTSEVDGNYSYQISQRVSSGRLEIFDSEWALLGLTQGVFVISPMLERPNREGCPNWWHPL